MRPTAATTASSSSSSAPSASTAAPTPAGSSGGSSGRPPVPPTLPGPPLMPPGPSPRRRTPNQAYYPNQSYGPNTYTTPPAANTILSPLTPNVLNPTTIEDAQEYAYRRGRNRGLVAGLIVGGGIEHIRHKRREKRMERKFAVERKDQGKKIENIRWDQIRETEAAKIREANAEKYRPIERAAPDIRPEAGRIAQAQSAAEVVRQKVEIQTEIEKKLEAERKETTRIISKAEQTEQERLHEQLELAQGHHIERSAWHNIEVDSHGKAVQETAFEYGHEYYKERGHETGPKTKQQVDTAAGEVALVAAALGGSGSGSSRDSIQGSSTQPHGTISVQTHPGVPHKQQSFLKTVTTPPTTPAGTVGWFVALVVILAVLLIVVF
ncbi:hypothetical protein IPL68_02375 [Candidatus Saccharibacteria bacterium]|nr:MAG: hypothetical protein IPL68_02375 [Candidatus Saccharibacteria bacterium]